MTKLRWVFILPVLVELVSAQISCDVDYEWSYNSLEQNPCTVATYLISPCHMEYILIPPFMYIGPTSFGEHVCLCNTVVYSLFSACAACQGASSISWSQWAYNCSSMSSFTTHFPAIPNGTRVPRWAYLDITITNNWNATAAKLAGDFPEAMPGVSSTEAISTSRPFSTAEVSSTSTPASIAGDSSTVAQSHSSSSSLSQIRSHSGQIAGASVGALVGVSLLIGIIFWYLRRWRLRAEIQQDRFSDSATRVAEMSNLPDLNHSTTIGRDYDPSDPNTFPKTGTQTAHNRGNLYIDGFTDSIIGPQYSGLAII